MPVLGIDQSLRCSGVFWISDHNNGWTQIEPGGLRGAERLLFIRNELTPLLKLVQPSLVAMEGYSYGSVGKLAELGELGGIIKMTAQEMKIPVVIVAPIQVKKFITGHARAEKEEVVEAINARLGMSWSVKDNDLADAAALALVADAYLNPAKLTLRHELEVVASLQKSVISKKRKRFSTKQKFHKI